jgi:hypothetical protein
MAKAVWACEKCGTVYGKESAAQECEKKHFLPVGSAKAVFSEKDNKNYLPARVTVDLVNGFGTKKVLSFYRHGDEWRED